MISTNAKIGNRSFGNWFDPDYTNSSLTQGRKLVTSIDGNIWVLDPDSSSYDKDLVMITDLCHDGGGPAGSEDRCLEPSWWSGTVNGQPELKILFVRESRTTPESQIYVVNDVDSIIQSAIDNNTSASPLRITSWDTISDTYLTLISHIPGDPDTPINNDPKWSPSWSVDGKLISYTEDRNNIFLNENFQSSVVNSLSSTNFDVYFTKWDDPVDPGDNVNINYFPQIIAENPYNEAFVRFAPSSGDKLTYISDLNGGYTVKLLSITTNASITPQGGIVKDNSYTTVDIPYDALSSDTKISIRTPLGGGTPSDTDSRLVSTGEVREFYADGQGITFDKPVKMILHYPDVDQNGFVDGTESYEYPNGYPENKLTLWYYNETESAWEEIGGDIDVNSNTLTIYTNHFSKYGIFGKKETKAYTNNDLRVYPNPCFISRMDNSYGVCFDQLPSIKDIRIYSIAGELVAKLNSGVVFEPASDKYNSTSAIDYAYWRGKNSNDKDIASGIYIYVIKFTDGSKKIGKIAIIK